MESIRVPAEEVCYGLPGKFKLQNIWTMYTDCHVIHLQSGAACSLQGNHMCPHMSIYAQQPADSWKRENQGELIRSVPLNSGNEIMLRHSTTKLCNKLRNGARVRIRLG